MDSETRCERLRRFEDVCRQRGLSLTVQRRVILEAVLDHADHPTADRIYDEVSRRIPGVSRTTVYRVLEMLVEVGVITKACSPGAATRFDPMTHRHHHLVCLHCDRLIDLEDAELNSPRRAAGVAGAFVRNPRLLNPLPRYLPGVPAQAALAGRRRIHQGEPRRQARRRKTG